MSEGFPAPPKTIAVKPEKVKEAIQKIEIKEAEPEEVKIQGEKPKVGNVVGVQKRFVGKSRSGISISAMQNKKKEERESEDPEDLTNKPRTSFTESELVGKWKSYSHKFKNNGRQGLYITLTKRPPVLKDNFKIEFTIDNEIQKMELNEERASILTYLRTELNNFGIQLEFIQNKEDNSVKHLSSKDKFIKMAEKNPALHELREKLNLDIEY